MLTTLNALSATAHVPNMLKALLRLSAYIRCIMCWLVHALYVALVGSGKDCPVYK